MLGLMAKFRSDQKIFEESRKCWTYKLEILGNTFLSVSALKSVLQISAWKLQNISD